jgi:hypothetical protein
MENNQKLGANRRDEHRVRDKPVCTCSGLIVYLRQILMFNVNN